MISATKPVDHAIAWTRQVLFSPFDAERWVTLGFCAFLAELESGSGGGFRANNVFQHHGKEGHEAFRRIFAWIGAHLALVIALGAILILLGLIVGMVLQWLNSRGQFMFLDCVKRNAAEVARPWRQFRRLGNNLFVFRLLFGLAAFGALLGILAVGFLIAHADIAARRFDTAAIAAIVVAGALLLVLAVGCMVLNQVITDFVVPIMYCRDVGTVAALRIFWERMLPGNIAGFACFYLLRAALVLGTVVLCCLVLCLTCCLAALPYLSSVVFLPVSVFFRSYSLCFLAQLGPEWQLLPAAAAPASAAPPPIPSASLPGG